MDREREIQTVNIDLIIPNRFQPRLIFDENSLNELAQSIKEHGLIQPIVVRKLADKYEIIAGERRYKACIIAGLTQVPVIIVSIDDKKSAEVALIENIQRKDLSPIEEAKSYKNILDRNSLTQEQLSKKIGVSQPTIANKLRLLNLSKETQEALSLGKISERHARSLLQVDNVVRQNELLQKVINERLTVKQLDSLIAEDKVKNETSDINTGEVISTTDDNIELSKDEVLTNIPTLQVEEKPEEISLDANVEVPSENSSLDSDVKEEVTKDFDIFGNNNFTDLNLDDNEISTQNDNIFDANYDEKVDFTPINIDTFNDKKNVDIFKMFNRQESKSLDDEVTSLDTGDSFNTFNEDDISPKIIPTEVHDIDSSESDEVVSNSKIKPGDFKSIKTTFDDIEKEIADAGFKISREDFDFNDLYQIIIKIDK